MWNPFFFRLRFTVGLSPAEFLDRLNARIKPMQTEDGFEKSLHPMGTVIGISSDTCFELQEAMLGYGGASLKGAVFVSREGTVVECVVRPSLYMQIGFAVMVAIYAVISEMYGRILFVEGFSSGRLLAFCAYTLIFLFIWKCTIRDMRGLETFVTDLAHDETVGASLSK